MHAFERPRAVLVDKDNQPKWSPDDLAAVSAERVESHFRALGDRDLHFA